MKSQHYSHTEKSSLLKELKHISEMVLSMCNVLFFHLQPQIPGLSSRDTYPETIQDVYVIWLSGRELICFLLGVGLHLNIHHSWGFCLCVCAYVCVLRKCCCHLIILQHHNMSQSTSASVIALLSDYPRPEPLFFHSLLTHKHTEGSACMHVCVFHKKWRLN